MNPKSAKIYIEEGSMNFYSWALIADGFLMSPKVAKYIGQPLRSAVLVAENNHGNWIVEQRQWNKLGQTLNKKLYARQFNLKQLVADHFKIGEKILESSNQITNGSLPKLSDNKIANWLSETWANYIELNGLGFPPVISDLEHNYLSDKLASILKQRLKNHEQVQEYLSTLISAGEPDLNWQETLEFLRLAKKYKNLKKLIQSPQFFDHIKKYCWINYGYTGPVWTKKEFSERAKKIFENTIPLASQLRAHEQYFKNLQLRQQQLEKDLKPTADEKYLFKAARIFMFLKAYRLNVRHKVQYAFELIFSELCRRHDLPIDSLRYATRQEILTLLAGKKIDLKKIVARKDGMVEITENGKKKILLLKNSRKWLNRILIEEKIEQTHEIKGQAAFLGKAIGAAKIVHGPKDMRKVQKGDVLIAPTTTPDILPAMGRAAAFVTDQGGITSHAAIVAREMKKPCVIGTKYATKILKDGDLVEVDANKGTVKKI